jgi:peroxiredoxin
MRMRMRLAHVWVIASLAAVSMAPGARAGAEAQAQPVPGHSVHGEAFDEGPRRAAYLMGTTGKVRFAITTKDPRAQRFFEQGLGQLHGFWYFEAERSFRQAAAIDPGCAMAYWGMAMANVNNETRAKAFLAEAVKRKEKAGEAGLTRYERMWIEALGSFYPAGKTEEKERRREYVRKLEEIVQEFPQEIEPRAFLALQIWNNDGRWPIGSRQAVDALLDQVFAAEPMHPAHHYRIHLWDNEKPARAVTSAARCGQASPGIAHMWHMPGHTYSKLKRYADAAWQQEASARVDHAHMVRDRVMPYQIHNYFHNNQWLCEDLAYVGRVRDAIDLAKNLVELPRHPKYNVVTNNGSGADDGRRRLIEVLSTYELWDEYVALCDTVYLDADGTPQSQARRLRYLGVAHARLGDSGKAAGQLAALEKMLAAVKDEQEAAGDKAAAEARDKKEPEDKADAAEGRARRGFRGRRREIEQGIAHVKGEVALAAKDHKKALEHLVKADLPKHALAQAHLAAGDAAKAERLAKEAADDAKNEVQPLANYVEVLYRGGKKDEAKAAFERLREISSDVDLAAPVFKRLAPVAEELGLPADWRLARKDPGDVGERPSLDGLGPFRWHPSPAEDWSLPAADGRSVGLTDFSKKGKPVVVLFYLGHGCVHCNTQLRTFAKEAKAFEDAGLALVAVSTDAVADLSKSLANAAGDASGEAKAGGGFAFPLVSDARLGVFKAYGAYDDFEKMPLHGTFLVDGRGDVRWQDISADPFTDTKFLLAEAKRLLAQPAWDADVTTRAAR